MSNGLSLFRWNGWRDYFEGRRRAMRFNRRMFQKLMYHSHIRYLSSGCHQAIVDNAIYQRAIEDDTRKQLQIALTHREQAIKLRRWAYEFMN